YVLDYLNAKLNPSELIEKIVEYWLKWKPYKLGIETVAAQQVIGFYLMEISNQRNLGVTYEEIRQQGDKLSKIKRLEPYFRAGQILIQPHHTLLQQQLLEFPQGDHDDLIDALQMTFDFKILPTGVDNVGHFDDLNLNYNEYGEPDY